MSFKLRPGMRAAMAVATFTTAVTVGGAGPAHADSQTTRDQSHDVRHYISSTQSTRVRADAGRDLLNGTARYRWGKLVIVLELRNVPRSDYKLAVMLKSKVGTFTLTYDHEGATPSTDYQTWVGATRSCPSASVRPRRVDDNIKVVLDRSCVGGSRATWIRFGVLASHDSSSGTLADDLRRDNSVDWSSHPRFGGRVHYN